MVGLQIAHYKVTAKLGAGGMGEVYRAHDEKLQRDVALKLLPTETFRDAEARARLLQEARAAAALNHPHICTIHEVGEAGGQAYIAMEFVEGRPLSELVQHNPLPTGDALRYGAQIADALAHAHDRRIVHRDLKSANVVISEGRAKVLDFGLAKRLREHELDEVTRSQASLTTPGAVIGTLAYMSPEQLRGQTADARSDIWALGVMLYQMAAGTRPFHAQTGFALSSAILNESPPPLTSKTPLQLRAVIDRCLQKDPARRYQRASELRSALEAIHSGSAAPWAALRYHVTGHAGWIAAAAVVIALSVGFYIWKSNRPPQFSGPLRAIPLTTLTGVARYPTFSPDGNHIAFSWTGVKQENTDIYVQLIGSGVPLRITTDAAEDYSPVWSPDNRWIAFLRRTGTLGENQLLLIPPLGGPERKIAEIRVQNASLWAPYICWCPQSDCLVVSDATGEATPNALFVVSLDSPEKKQLTRPEPPSPGDTHPAVSPDGKWLVFRRNASGPFSGQLYRLPLNNDVTPAGGEHRMTTPETDGGYPAWLPDSQQIIFSSWAESLWRLNVTSDTPPERLPFVGENGMMPAISRAQPGGSSRLVYVQLFRDTNFWQLEIPSRGATSAPVASGLSSTRQDYHPQFSPDGRQVAFGSNRSVEAEIWLAGPDGANAIQLTTGAAGSGFPRWSPQGDRLLYLANPEKQWDVYIVPAAGGKPRNVTSHPAMDAWSTFSRDGEWIYFTSDRTGDFRIWRIPASGGEATPVTEKGTTMPRESPDGKFLYYLNAIDTPSPLWRVPIAGGPPERILDGVVLANYVVLEKGIYYIDRLAPPATVFFIDPTAGETRLQYYDFATRKTTTLARNLGNVFIGLTVSPDGQNILYTRLDVSIDNLMLVENFR